MNGWIDVPIKEVNRKREGGMNEDRWIEGWMDELSFFYCCPKYIDMMMIIKSKKIFF